MGADIVALPQPIRSGGLSLAETLDSRHSVREYDSSRPVRLQDLSNILWAAVGVNRPQDDKLTSPTAMNKQEISAYVISVEGAFLYDARKNELHKVADGDHRSLVAGTAGFSQDYVLDAPVSILLVADTAKLPSPEACMIDAGIACENINLAAQALGLATVPRLTMDKDALHKVLGLSPDCMVVLNNPVGYAK